MDTTFSCAYMGNLVVVVHTTQPPSAVEWTQQMAELESKGNLGQFRVLVYSDGGGPSHEQRAQLTKAMNGAETTTAVLTASMVMRGICTAMSWFNQRLKVFPPHKLEDAMRHLDVTRDEKIRILTMMRQMMMNLGMDSSQVAALAARH